MKEEEEEEEEKKEGKVSEREEGRARCFWSRRDAENSVPI